MCSYIAIYYIQLTETLVECCEPAQHAIGTLPAKDHARVHTIIHCYTVCIYSYIISVVYDCVRTNYIIQQVKRGKIIIYESTVLSLSNRIYCRIKCITPWRTPPKSVGQSPGLGEGRPGMDMGQWEDIRAGVEAEQDREYSAGVDRLPLD